MNGQPDRHEQLAGAFAMYAFVVLLWGLVVIGLVAAWRWAL